MGRWWCWLVFALALPALVSPLLFVPLNSALPRWLVLLAGVLEYPKYWAAAATVAGILGARRFGDSSVRLAIVAVIVVSAWLIGTDTAFRIGHIF